MKPVPIIFVDTSGWYAHFSADDANNAAAQSFMQTSSGSLITTNYVIDETITLIRVRVGHHAAVEAGEALWNQQYARIARVSPEDEAEAWRLFKRYSDKQFSFTDCTSFAVMARLGIQQAFAFDADFERTGQFVTVP